MGSCTSKFMPNKKKNSNHKRKEEDQCNGSTVDVPAEDKLVITALQDPSSVESSHASFATSPVSCDTACHNSSSSSSHSSSLSSAFSMSTSKDKSSYSNDFLRSCIEKNSQIVVLDPTKPAGTAQKRQRASSPNLTRQKSFRRFNSAQHERNPKKIVSDSKGSCGYGKSNNTVVKKENRKGLSDPNTQSRRLNRSPSMRRRTDTRGHNWVVSRVNGVSIGEGKGVIRQDVEMLPAENLDNPLIALDCFIFL